MTPAVTMFVLRAHAGVNAPKRGTAKDMLRLAGQTARGRQKEKDVRAAAIAAAVREARQAQG